MDITNNTNKLLDFISDKYIKEELDDDSLVKIIELCGKFLNLETIRSYQDTFNISYNGVVKYRRLFELFGVRFVSENN